MLRTNAFPLQSLLQYPLDSEAGRSIGERERRSEGKEGAEEPWEGGSRDGRDTSSVLLPQFEMSIRTTKITSHTVIILLQ